MASQAFTSWGVKTFNGRDALPRVRDGKPNRDAEHRVPTGAVFECARETVQREVQGSADAAGRSRRSRCTRATACMYPEPE
jgi:hypothetical protein